MKNYTTLAGSIILVWLCFSPIIGLLLFFQLSDIYTSFPDYFAPALVIMSYVFFGILGRTVINKNGGFYSEKEKDTDSLLEDEKFGLFDIKFPNIRLANKVINETVWSFWILGLILFILSLILPNLFGSAWLDALLAIFFSSLFIIKRNTFYSIIMLLLGVSTVVGTAISKITGEGGSNIFLAFIMLWASIRSVMAVKYIKNKKENNYKFELKKSHRILFSISKWLSGILLIIMVLVLFSVE